MTKLALVLLVVSCFVLYAMALKRSSHSGKDDQALKASNKNLLKLKSLRQKGLKEGAKALRKTVILRGSMAKADVDGRPTEQINLTEMKIQDLMNGVQRGVYLGINNVKQTVVESMDQPVQPVPQQVQPVQQQVQPVQQQVQPVQQQVQPVQQPDPNPLPAPQPDPTPVTSNLAPSTDTSSTTSTTPLSDVSASPTTSTPITTSPTTTTSTSTTSATDITPSPSDPVTKTTE